MTGAHRSFPSFTWTIYLIIVASKKRHSQKTQDISTRSHSVVEVRSTTYIIHPHEPEPSEVQGHQLSVILHSHRMDGPFVAANTAALAAAARSVQIATDFLSEVPAAQNEVEPVLAELCDLRGILECLQNVTLPDPLFAPLTRVVRGCTDICRCIDGIFTECGDGPLRPGRWALTEAPFETRRLERVLEAFRKTVKLTMEAIDL